LVKSYHFTSTTGGSLRRVIAFRCQKSSDSKISPNPMNDDAQSPGLLLVKNRAPPKGGAQKEGKRGKEQKEKGLLLHPPLRHEPA
jgi:hypothetical protein